MSKNKALRVSTEHFNYLVARQQRQGDKSVTKTLSGVLNEVMNNDPNWITKKGLTVEEIKQAVDQGKSVYWSNAGYQVIKDCLGQYLIQSLISDSCIGLTHRDGITLNGKESEFFIK